MKASVRLNGTRSLPCQRTTGSTQRATGGLSGQHPAALRLRSLCKRFGDHVIVDNAELEVPCGRVVGLLGAAGAGKTTLLSMATGLLPADGGEAWIFGMDVRGDRKDVKPVLGVVPAARPMPEHVTGREALMCSGVLRGLHGQGMYARAGEVLETAGLATAATTLVAEYSAGMRKRLSLAAALLHDPALLVLDEPFEGVDIESAAQIGSVIRRLAAEGGAVLLASRVRAPVDGLCDQVTELAEGRITGSDPVLRRSAELAVAGA